MRRQRRSYDYGLRGVDGGGPGYDSGFRFRNRGFDPRFDERSEPRIGYRVTARYNDDYVRGPANTRYRNYHMYTGDRPERVGDERMYRYPYMTIGGTRTYKGSRPVQGYDYPDYGPNYGGRYPDELL